MQFGKGGFSSTCNGHKEQLLLQGPKLLLLQALPQFLLKKHKQARILEKVILKFNSEGYAKKCFCKHNILIS